MSERILTAHSDAVVIARDDSGSQLVDAQKEPSPVEAHARAAVSRGISNEAILRAVVREWDAEGVRGRLIDVGCGRGDLWRVAAERCTDYRGVDLVRYDELPVEAVFVEADLNVSTTLPDATADVVVSVETIEHLENPRAFVRELVRITRPGGLVLLTTPNQLSLLSKLTLLRRHRFQAFQDVNYPAHITALLECDLRRIASECGLTSVRIAFSGRGRMPGVPWHWPRSMSAWFPRALSDNILLVGRRPAVSVAVGHDSPETGGPA